MSSQPAGEFYQRQTNSGIRGRSPVSHLPGIMNTTSVWFTCPTLVAFPCSVARFLFGGALLTRKLRKRTWELPAYVAVKSSMRQVSRSKESTYSQCHNTCFAENVHQSIPRADVSHATHTNFRDMMTVEDKLRSLASRQDVPAR